MSSTISHVNKGTQQQNLATFLSHFQVTYFNLSVNHCTNLICLLVFLCQKTFNIPGLSSIGMSGQDFSSNITVKTANTVNLRLSYNEFALVPYFLIYDHKLQFTKWNNTRCKRNKYKNNHRCSS